MTDLSTARAVGTPQSSGSVDHPDEHNIYNTILNKVFNGDQTAVYAGEDVQLGAAATMASLMEGSFATPASVLGPAFKVTRSELHTASPNVFDAAYNAVIKAQVTSQIGNIVQPTAGYFVALGYTDPIQYVLPVSEYSLHTVGVSGGAMGRYSQVISQVAYQPVAIASVSVANPTVVTTSTPHGLASGDRIAISGTTTTPTINGLAYTVTVTGASTFTIQVHVISGQAAPAGQINGPSIFGWGTGIFNNTGYDMTKLQMRGGGIDLNIGGPNIAGNAFQVRAADAGLASLFYGTGASLVGFDTSAMSISGPAFLARSSGGITVTHDTVAAGQAALETWYDGGLTFPKFQIGKDTANNFILYDVARTVSPIVVAAADGGLTLAATGKKLGFYGHTPAVQPSGVASTAAAIITALQSIGVFA